MNSFAYDEVARRLEDQKIMLVGGAGFIGHNLALELRRFGAQVLVADNLMVNSIIDNSFDDERSEIQRQLYTNFLLDRFKLMREAGIQLRNADARLFNSLAELFDSFSPTKVVHLSAIASAVEARKDPGLCFDLQLVTLRNVLELCRMTHGHDVQLLLLSSSTVYGDFETPEVDESTRPRPQGIYANAKYMAERMVRTYCHQHGLGTTIVRPSALYGERCVSRRVSQVFIENALSGKPLLLEGGGMGRLDFTYVADLVNGIVRALALYDGPGTSQTFNLTFGNARTIMELAEIVRNIVPSAAIEERPRAADKPVRGTLSTQRARDVLGFEPSWPLEVGYRQYCEWYVEQWERAATEVRSN